MVLGSVITVNLFHALVVYGTAPVKNKKPGESTGFLFIVIDQTTFISPGCDQDNNKGCCSFFSYARQNYEKIANVPKNDPGAFLTAIFFPFPVFKMACSAIFEKQRRRGD